MGKDEKYGYYCTLDTCSIVDSVLYMICIHVHVHVCLIALLSCTCTA